MKKKIVMGLFVLATVIGMGFAGTKTIEYSCGHKEVKTVDGNIKTSFSSSSKCPDCEDKACKGMYGKVDQSIYDNFCGGKK